MTEDDKQFLKEFLEHLQQMVEEVLPRGNAL